MQTQWEEPASWMLCTGRRRETLSRKGVPGRAAVRVYLAGRQTDWFVPLTLSSLTVRKATLVTTLFLLATDFQGNGTKTWTEKGL